MTAKPGTVLRKPDANPQARIARTLTERQWAREWVWDFWFADDGRLFHIFYLQAPRSLGDPGLRHRHARIGHATSADLVHWKPAGEVLGPARR